MTAKLDLTRAFSDHGVTSKTIAERIGLTPQTVSSYVNGNPSVGTLYRIAEALGCDVRDLFYPVPSSADDATHDVSLSKAIITCPHCGETLITSLAPFPKS